MKKLLTLFLVVSFLSCATSGHLQKNSFYLAYTDTDLSLYALQDSNTVILLIPAGSQIFLGTNTKDFRQVNFRDWAGYIKAKTFTGEIAFKNASFKKPLTSNEYGLDTIVNAERYKQARYFVNNNYRASSSFDSTSYVPGSDVHVRGYYRKNGTYVAPYTRRAPRHH